MRPDEWGRCAPFLLPAIERGGEGVSIEDLRQMVDAGRAGLIPGERSAAIVQVAKTFHTWLAGGDLGELRRMEAAASDWARANGCSRMTIRGRKGWERALPGYRPQLLLVKDLA